jgi:hypothetical protein
MLARAGCSNVEALNLDFLTTNPKDEKYARVTHMYGFFPPFSLSSGRARFFRESLYHPSISRETLDFLIRPAAVLASLTALTTS